MVRSRNRSTCHCVLSRLLRKVKGPPPSKGLSLSSWSSIASDARCSAAHWWTTGVFHSDWTNPSSDRIWKDGFNPLVVNQQTHQSFVQSYSTDARIWKDVPPTQAQSSWSFARFSSFLSVPLPLCVFTSLAGQVVKPSNFSSKVQQACFQRGL